MGLADGRSFPLLGGTALMQYQWRKHSTRSQTVSVSKGCELGVVPAVLTPVVDIPPSQMQGMLGFSSLIDTVLLLISLLVVRRPARMVVTTIAIR